MNNDHDPKLNPAPADDPRTDDAPIDAPEADAPPDDPKDEGGDDAPIDDPSIDDAPLDDPQDDGDDAREARLIDYLDGELPPHERAALEAELAADPALRAELDALKETFGALKNLQTQPAPPAFVFGVEGAIRTRTRGRFFEDDFFYRTRIPYEAFAALMIAIMAAMYFFGQPPAPEINGDQAAMGGEPTDPDAGRPRQLPPDAPDAPEAPSQAPPPDAGPSPAADPPADAGHGALNPAAPDPALDPADKLVAPTPAANPASEAPPARANDAPPQREVLPIRRERVIYTIQFDAPNPADKIRQLSAQIRALGASFTILANGDEAIQVRMPPAQVESFLAGVGKGGRVARMRIHQQTSQPDDPLATVHIGARRAIPGQRALTPSRRP